MHGFMKSRDLAAFGAGFGWLGLTLLHNTQIDVAFLTVMGRKRFLTGYYRRPALAVSVFHGLGWDFVKEKLKHMVHKN